jgi:hypothetical protein
MSRMTPRDQGKGDYFRKLGPEYEKMMVELYGIKCPKCRKMEQWGSINIKRRGGPEDDCQCGKGD